MNEIFKFKKRFETAPTDADIEAIYKQYDHIRGEYEYEYEEDRCWDDFIKGEGQSDTITIFCAVGVEFEVYEDDDDPNTLIFDVAAGIDECHYDNHDDDYGESEEPDDLEDDFFHDLKKKLEGWEFFSNEY